MMYAVVLLLVALFAGGSLLSGAAYIETLLPGGLPVGNALTAIGMCAAAGAAMVLSTRGSYLRRGAVAVLVAAALWLPVSIRLAGNLALNFRGGHGTIWLGMTLVIIVACVIVVLWALLARVVALGRSTRTE